MSEDMDRINGRLANPRAPLSRNKWRAMYLQDVTYLKGLIPASKKASAKKVAKKRVATKGSK